MEEWNNNTISYPRENAIHQLFEEQVNRTPDALAVVDEKQQLTYRELNERANQLAHHLQKCGIGTESLVGLCFERSVEMVVGLMEFGRLDLCSIRSIESESRLQYILEDTGIKVLVTNEVLLGWIPKDIKTVCLDRTSNAFSRKQTFTNM